MVQEPMACLIAGLRETLEELIFPINVFTRKQPDFSGSTLHMPSVIRFYTSRFTYRKIFLKCNAGGKRSYNICILIDRSASMTGQQAQQGLVALVHSLHTIGLDFSLIAFGAGVHLLKTDQEPFDNRVMYQLLNLPGCTDTTTNDASAIQFGLELMKQADVVQKAQVMLVLTDGYSSQGLELTRQLTEAEAQGVKVLAISIGLEESGVQQAYADWVCCVIPEALPSGLASWALGSGQHTESHPVAKILAQNDKEETGQLATIWQNTVPALAKQVGKVALRCTVCLQWLQLFETCHLGLAPSPSGAPGPTWRRGGGGSSFGPGP